jgi:hypothetical protein
MMFPRRVGTTRDFGASISGQVSAMGVTGGSRPTAASWDVLHEGTATAGPITAMGGQVQQCMYSLSARRWGERRGR